MNPRSSDTITASAESIDLEETSAVIRRALSGLSPTAVDVLNRRLLEADQGEFPTRPQSESSSCTDDRVRVAIVSLLFNWPSTGGGIVHTAELAKFLTRDGYEVCHFYAVHSPWSVGSVTEPLPYHSVAIQFTDAGWNREDIQHAFRDALETFQPDCVIVTDSWNSKGLLAAAASKWPYFIRLAAMECLCPLNNVRLLVDAGGEVRQCPQTQLATRDVCVACVSNNARMSGSLHAMERQLAGFGTVGFDAELRTVFADAEAILVVNPFIGALCEPYARAVHVIPSGFDPARFQDLPQRVFGEGGIRILFAGIVNEFMKGFHVLWEACHQLWNLRQDFELHVTADDSNIQAPFLRSAGWKSQDELPLLMAHCDIVVVPTVAQEALGRTAVEAMGASRPVVASRIGGLPWVVAERETGLLFEPGNASELCACLNTLLDNQGLSQSMGTAGRQQFDARFTWDQILKSHYRPMLSTLRRVR